MHIYKMVMENYSLYTNKQKIKNKSSKIIFLQACYSYLPNWYGDAIKKRSNQYGVKANEGL